MSMPADIPLYIAREQIAASDPSASAWVAANAGSGKTYVLTQRVIRLLLNGTEPAKILCLTFTKAAAANMANKVFARLAEWITLDDEELDRAVAAIEGRKPDAARRARARRLFAEALETPGGLKVQTIHAFCTRLLHQFPFEANVAAGFAVLEERAERDLLERLRLEVLLEAAANPESGTGRALATAIGTAADRTFSDVISEAITKRDALTSWLDHAQSVEAAVRELSAVLGMEPHEHVEDAKAEITDGPIMPPDEWAGIAAILAGGSKTDRERSERLLAAAAATGAAREEAYLHVFLTDNRVARSRIVTRSFAGQYPDLTERLALEQSRIVALEQRIRAIMARDRTAALLAIADAMIGRYRAEKAKQGLLDYNDLIDSTLTLMTRVDAAWIHYKLDLGIDHVLIDEAQDTSPKQWEIIKRLVSEFTAGEGARGSVRRSIFAVGDEKQSIFSFQGADPQEFTETRKHFEQGHRDAELEFRFCQFKLSFRSGANVLSAVDRVFYDREIYRSVTTDAVGIPQHDALPGAAPGHVEIWPLVEAEKRPEIEGWDAPFDEVSETSPQVRLAQRIAASIRLSIDRGRKPGEFLVLVRQRGALFEAIIRALKNAQIAVAGADRLVLTEHIAIMDLMVLADALLMPDDDLALATVLKSPLFGFDDDQLFALAWRRSGTLRRALRAKSDEAPLYAEAADRLDRLERAARSERPFAFYARLLGPERGRKKILARLGTEAIDALDELLNLALEYEARETASLQGFVAWLRAAVTEVKRDMDLVRDEVRVMTVHGAKGLEAPVAILADTTTRPTGPRDPRLLGLPARGVAPGTPERLVWAGAKETDVPPVAKARALARRAAEDEYRRLLYVALTRAAEKLIVCGAQGATRRPEGCWYDLVVDALYPETTAACADDGSFMVWRWQKVVSAAVPEFEPAPTMEAAAETPPPAWLTRDAPPNDIPHIISPSSALEDTLAIRPRASASPGRQRDALLHGRLVHRLMQALPEIPSAYRAEAARKYLARSAAGLTDAELVAVLAKVLGILADPEFAPLFAIGTHAEVPIVGRISRDGRPPLIVSGQVDRLAVSETGILVGDYKTNRPAPRGIDEVPQSYLTQLALYRAVLGTLYPRREVRAALIWTDIPALMELPAAALDAALAAIP